MASRKTSEAGSTDSVSSKPAEETITTVKKKTFRSITKDHANQALTYYLRTLKMIDPDEEVTHYNSILNEFKVEKFKHD